MSTCAKSRRHRGRHESTTGPTGGPSQSRNACPTVATIASTANLGLTLIASASRHSKTASIHRNNLSGGTTAAIAATRSKAYGAAEALVAAAEAEAAVLTAGRDEAETEELRTALGAGGTGKGTAGALRGATGAIKDLERRQKSRQTRASRDALDRALIDLATYFRDALLVAASAGDVRPNHPDMAAQIGSMAAHVSADRLLRCIEAVLECREALAINVKPKFAVDAMVATIGQALRD